MLQKKPDLGALAQSPQAAALLANKDTLLGLSNSPDAQRLLQMLNQTGGAGLESAADAAICGNPAQLIALMEQVMKSPEGAKAVESIRGAIQPK